MIERIIFTLFLVLKRTKFKLVTVPASVPTLCHKRRILKTERIKKNVYLMKLTSLLSIDITVLS